ncbi:PQQ-binding-like beta-propeller repeat protein, partial [Candidatus Woesearchaeota archaeon]|nr:PQQ-binding-like beta-propeller repeat protein [Candidatus Woesearchaeota archaeon]
MKDNNLWFHVSVLLVLIIFLVSFGTHLNFVGKTTHILGMFVDGEFQDNVDKWYESNKVYLWSPSYNVNLHGVALSGNVSGTGEVKTYLVHEQEQYLINSFTVDNEVVRFDESCTETCDLGGLESKKYLLRFEIAGDVRYQINSIKYSSSSIIGQEEIVDRFSPTTPVEELVDDLVLELEGTEKAIPEDITVSFKNELGYELSAQKTKRQDGKFDLVFGEEAPAFGAASESPKSKVTVKGLTKSVNAKLGTLEGKNTEVFAMDHVTVDEAIVTLTKTGEVNAIQKCDEFDVTGFSCNSGWYETNLDFTDNGATITFTVNSFSGYAGINSSSQTNSEWIMQGRFLNHTGYYPESLNISSLSNMWTYSTGSSLSEGPAIKDGVAYLPANDQKLHAINLTDGEKIWEVPLVTSSQARPALVNGVLYFGSATGIFYAINITDQSEVWNFSSPNQIRTSAAVVDGKVFFGSTMEEYFALNQTNGEQIWNNSHSVGVGGASSSPGYSDGMIFYGSRGRKFYAVNATNGEQIWNQSGYGYDLASTPLIVRDEVFFGAYLQVYSYNKTNGDLIWNFSKSSNYFLAGLATDQEKIYAGSYDDKLYALNITNGEQVWNFSAGNNIYATATTTPTEVILAANNSVFIINSTTGEQIWNYTIHDTTQAQPAIVDGNLFVASENGDLYAFGTVIDYTPDTTSYNQSSENQSEWWMFGKYLNHTSWDGVSYPTVSGLNRANFTATNNFYSGIAVAEGAVYAGSWDKNVYRFNATNISLTETSFLTGGVIYTSSPVIVEGFVYVGSDDGRIYQLNSSTMVQHANFTTGNQVRSSPAVANGYVYVGSNDHNVYQLNASNVSIQYANFTTGGTVYSSPAVANGYVYIGSADNNVYQLNANNVSIQYANFTTPDQQYSGPAVVDGFVYVGGSDFSETTGHIFKLNASNISIQSSNFTVLNGIFTYSSPTIVEDSIYIGNTDGTIYQINKTTMNQTANFTSGDSIQSAPAVADGFVYVGSNDYNVYQLNSSTLVQYANFTTGGIVFSSPAVANGYVYVGSADDSLYQLLASNISLGNAVAIDSLVNITLTYPTTNINVTQNEWFNVTLNASCIQGNCGESNVSLRNGITYLTYLGETSSDYGTSIVETSDGGFVVTGDTLSYGGVGGDLLLSKFDSSGNELWTKSLGGDSSERGYSVVETSDGGFIVTGHTYSYGGSDYDVLLVKFNSSGAEQWTKSLGGSSSEKGFDVVETSEGDFVVTGSTQSYGDGGDSILLVKFNSSGVEQWTKSLGGNNNDVGRSIVETSDGGFVVTGYTQSYGDGGVDVLLAKFNSSGNELWTKSVGGASVEWGYDVIEISGGFVVTGYTHSYGSSDADVLLIKFDSSGNELWTKYLSGNSDDEGHAVVEASDGGFVVTGRTKSYGGIDIDVLLVKFDSSGNELWTKSLGGGLTDIGESIIETDDKGFVVSGSTSSYGGSSADILLVKFDHLGNVEGLENIVSESAYSSSYSVSAVTNITAESDETVAESDEDVTELDETAVWERVQVGYPLVHVGSNVTLYTNKSNNPSTISLNSGESELVVFYVNATGNNMSTYEIFGIVNLTDSLNINSQTSKINVTILTVVDTILPNVTLSLPVNETNTTDTTIYFAGNASDETALDNVSLMLNGEYNFTNSTGLINGSYNISFTFAQTNATYLWGLEACDTSGNCNTTENRTLWTYYDPQPIAMQSSENETEWWMFGKYLNHTSWDGVSYPTINGLNRANFTSSSNFHAGAAVVNGFVYVGSYDNNVYQLNASNISIQYANFTTGHFVLSSPVAGGGFVYVSGFDNYTYQLNASNISQQVANFTTNYRAFVPVVANGYVYLGSNDHNVYQLNASNISQQVANFTTGHEVWWSPAVANGYVYVGSYDNTVYQLNASNIGQQVANFTGGGAYSSAPVVVDGFVYVGGSKFYQLNASNISIQYANFSTGGSLTSSPAVVDGFVYVGCENNDIYQLNASNISIQYANFTSGDRIYAPSVADGFVYVGSMDDNIYQLNASNISIQYANFTTGNNVYATPAVANGYVYVGSWDDSFYQLLASNISQGNAAAIVDTTLPNVTLEAPINETNTTDTTIYFAGNASDETALDNVSLLLDGEYNYTNSSGLVNGSYNISFTFAQDNVTYLWALESCDTSGNCNTTENFTLYTHYYVEPPTVYNQSSENATEWWMFGKFLNHTSWDGVSYPTVSGLNRANFTTGNFVYSSPAVANGFVYIGSYDNNVYQLNASNLSIQYANFTTGGLTSSSPAVVNGFVYVGSRDDTLYQLNVSNISQQIANFTTGGDIDSSPVVADGFVYVGSDDNNLYQLNASNVSIQYANFTISQDVSSIPAVANGFVYVGGVDSYVYQLNASNISQQFANFSTSGIVLSSPAVADGFVYIGSFDDKTVYQLNASNISIQYATFITGGTVKSSPVVADGFVYIGSYDNNTYQLNASNISIQYANFTTGDDIHSSPTVANGFVYVGSYDNNLYQLNASNVSIQYANFSIGLDVFSSPAVANGYVYLGIGYGVYQLLASNISQGNAAAIVDSTLPNATLEAPVNETNTTSTVVYFAGNASDETALANVSLLLDGAYNFSNSSGLVNGSYNISFTFAQDNATYLWGLEACDTGGNCNTTDNYTLITYYEVVPLVSGANSSSQNTSEWRMLGRYLNHTGYYPAEVNMSGFGQLWNFSAGTDFVYATPTIANGMVYASTGSTQGRYTYALNKTTGSIIWNFTREENDFAYSSPAIADGKAFFGSDSAVFFAVNDTTGLQLW